MKRRIVHLGIVVLAALPLLLCAQDVSRRFHGDPASRPYYMWGMRGMMQAAGLRMNRREEEPASADPTDAQWHEISEYMKRDLPNAWELYQHQTVSRQAKMRRQVFAKFQATQTLRLTGQLELYSLRLQQQKLWDQTAGLIKQWHSVSLDRRPAVRKQIRAKVHEAMVAALKEQELRIHKLEQALTDAKTRLADDRKNINDTVERRSERLLDESSPGVEPSEQAAVPTTQPSQSTDR